MFKPNNFAFLQMSARFRLGLAVLLVLTLLTQIMPADSFAQTLPAPPASVQQMVDQDDLPVNTGAAHRSFTWGQYFAVQNEPYKEAANGSRQVFYYDKGRLEVNNSQTTPTSGLLLREMITGQVQLGDNSFSQREPANVVLAGDNPPQIDSAPTYADLQELVSFDGSWKAANLTGGKAGLFLQHGGNVENSFAGLTSVTYAQYDAATGHNIADVFFRFMNSSGLVYDGSKVVNAPLYNALYVFGHPISEPYWTQVTVAGQKRYVLIQGFERRLLTYTPDNPAAFQVELGNIGRAYYQWRYGQPGPAPATDPATPLPTPSPALDFYNQAVTKLNAVNSVQFTQYTALQQVQQIRYEAPNKRFLLEQDSECGPSGFYAEIDIETRVYANCIVNNQPQLTWVYIDTGVPFRWPVYAPIGLNDISADYSFGPDGNIGGEPVKNIITNSLDLTGESVATITGFSVNSGLPLEGSRTYSVDGQQQIFNTKYDNYNQAFNIQAPSGAVPYNADRPNTLTPLASKYGADLPGQLSKPSASNLAAPGEILVKFRQPAATVQQLIAQSQALADWKDLGSFQAISQTAGVLKVKPEATKATLAALRASPNVAYAEPNYLYSSQTIDEPNDSQYSSQWYLKAIRMPRAWSISTGQLSGDNSSSLVKVAVIDTGVNVNHPDLRPNVVSSVDFFDGSSPTADPVGHGTLVAGTITAQGNNGQFGAGISWHSQLYAYRVGDRRGLTCDAIAKAILDATAKGVRVINMSFGGTQPCQTMADAVANAVANGVVMVAAAGNDATNVPSYPAAFPGVIAVAALGRLGTPASFSNYGSYVSLSAPGVDVCGTAGPNRFGCASGTSFSSPIVVGAVVLMLSVNPNLTASQVKNILVNTTVPAPGKSRGQFDDHYGYGSLDAYAAVRAAATNQLLH